MLAVQVYRGGRCLFVVALTAWVFAAALPAAAQNAPPRAPFGINGGVLWPDGMNLLPTAVHAAAIGRTPLTTVRAIPFWDQIEPLAPDPRTGAHSYDWTRPDAIAAHLARNGLRWDALLGFSTIWAGQVPGTTGGTPRAGPFATYAAAIARRYGRDGEFWRLRPELPYVPMTTFQVWNEPNLPGSALAIDPKEFANIYLATREAIHRVDPSARVAVGGLVHSAPSGDGNAASYLRAMFAARPDLRGNIDAVGLTIYRQTPEQVLEQLRTARAVLDELGARDVLLDLNETGWTTRGLVPLTDLSAITEQERSARLTRLVELLAAADCGIASVEPFAWVSSEDSALDGAAWLGLANRGDAGLKPSGAALVAAITAVLERPPVGMTVCGRPDLPRLVRPDFRRPQPFAPRVTKRSCASRRFTLRYGSGGAAEPISRVEVTLPRGKPRPVTDPDGAGPLEVPGAVRLPIPRRAGHTTVVAYDAQGAESERHRLTVRRCPTRKR